MRCVGCGNEEHPKTALFCVKCGQPLGPLPYKPVTQPVFPALCDIHCWLEGTRQRNGFLGPHCRAFAICFTVMPAPKQAIVVDGNLHLKIVGILNKADLELEVRARKEDFAVRRFDLMTVSFQSLSYTYRHSQSVIPVPTDGGCKLDLALIADRGEVYKGSLVTFFIDREPGMGPRVQRPWTAQPSQSDERLDR
jgi:hypothetical protein